MDVQKRHPCCNITPGPSDLSLRGYGTTRLTDPPPPPPPPPPPDHDCPLAGYLWFSFPSFFPLSPSSPLPPPSLGSAASCGSGRDGQFPCPPGVGILKRSDLFTSNLRVCWCWCFLMFTLVFTLPAMTQKSTTIQDICPYFRFPQCMKEEEVKC